MVTLRSIAARRKLLDSRGAVYVEFTIAFMPVFVMFLSLIQLADLHQANIIVRHAAFMGVRAAVVVLPDDGQFYDGEQVNTFDGKRKDAINYAVMGPLLASRSISEYKVTLPSSPGGDDSRSSVQPNDLVRLKVQAHFQCRVPMVSILVCGSSKERTLTGEAAMPNQGASYDY